MRKCEVTRTPADRGGYGGCLHMVFFTDRIKRIAASDKSWREGLPNVCESVAHDRRLK